MCKGDFHESTWNCAKLTTIIPIYSLGKNPRNSPFSVVELYEGKVPENRDFRDF